MLIDPGKLDRTLQILSQTRSEGPTGQVIEAYAPGVTIYAQRLEMRTVDATRAGQRDTYAIARFQIRYRADLTTANRVVCEGVTYAVLAVDEPAGQRRSALVLTCEQIL